MSPICQPHMSLYVNPICHPICLLSYEYVGANCGIAFRRIKFKCPVTNEYYVFLTNLTQIPPGLVAFLYKLRWDIEKVFDEIKNKMEEKKAWATSATAKNIQAEFICIAHNLMLIVEEKLKTEEGIENKLEIKRKIQRLEIEIKSASKNGIELPHYIRKLKRITQRSIKFVRWIRNNIFDRTPWQAALMSLKLSYEDF